MSLALRVVGAILAVLGLLFVAGLVLGLLHWVVIGAVVIGLCLLVFRLVSPKKRAIGPGDKTLHRQLKQMERDIKLHENYLEQKAPGKPKRLKK
jgi:hypothetical protein